MRRPTKECIYKTPIVFGSDEHNRRLPGLIGVALRQVASDICSGTNSCRKRGIINYERSQQHWKAQSTKDLYRSLTGGKSLLLSYDPEDKSILHQTRLASPAS